MRNIVCLAYRLAGEIFGVPFSEIRDADGVRDLHIYAFGLGYGPARCEGGLWVSVLRLSKFLGGYDGDIFTRYGTFILHLLRFVGSSVNAISLWPLPRRLAKPHALSYIVWTYFALS